MSKLLHETGGKLKATKKELDENKVCQINTLHRQLSDLTLQPKRDKMSGLSRKAKRRKMIMEEDKEFGDSKSMNASIRAAKKAARPAKIGVPEKKPSRPVKKHKSTAKKSRTDSVFSSELGQKAKATPSREGIRAKKDDAVKLGKKGGGKPKKAFKGKGRK